ncbi:MAG: alpha/beta hydrolase family protein [Parasphingopyxis sp.]|uniref:alpha/beta hydrolase family protein n=1 Tax=Parasphingopyxis sp. TaxID=1920299 RepID=UPI003FA04C30
MSGDTLHTSSMHRMLCGPLGWLLTTGLFNNLKMAMLPREFRMARARSVAVLHTDPSDFLNALGATDAARRRLEGSATKALTELAHRRAALQPVEAQWEDAVWGGEPSDPSTLVALEEKRRALSEAALKPGMLFRFLWKEPSIAPTGFATPDPAEALSQATGWLEKPELLYAAPEAPAAVERSASIPGPAGPEYLIRFRSPSPFTDRDTVTARVYQPASGSTDAPTFVFGSGLGMVYDLIGYWPEEDYMARRLARRGVRTILPESPWHGRRELPGRYSGEPYLARAPVSIYELFSAQARETAAIVAWARSEGARRVGVGGVSLSGLVAQQVVGHCGAWPEAMRPDMVFIGAGSSHVDQVVVMGDLSERLGMTAAVRGAGWTDALLAKLRPLLDPPETPAIPPEAILTYLGSRDRSTPYALARQLLDRWKVPERNRIVHDADHMALYTRLIRSDEAASRIADMLQ